MLKTLEYPNTYTYSATFLTTVGVKVSVVNPACVKGFSMSRLSRVKTDKADCELIAYFCQAIQPDLWQPVPSHVQELQQWVRRLDSLITNKHQDLNDRNTLLASIPGIGEKTIGVILAFLNVENFNSAKQLAAFVGLNPKPRQSGSSLRGVGRISKTGDANLRKAFYMPALTAMRFNPIIKNFSERLSNTGKSKMVIVIAAMRKLLHIIYGVLKNKTPFNRDIKTI